jgi:hypothetical protein
MPEVRFTEEDLRVLADVEQRINDRFEEEFGRYRAWLNDEEMETVRKSLIAQTRAEASLTMALKSVATKIAGDFGGRVSNIENFVDDAMNESSELIDPDWHLSETPLWEKLEISPDEEARLEAVEREVLETFEVARPFRPVPAGDSSLEGKQTVDLGEVMDAVEEAFRKRGLDRDRHAAFLNQWFGLQHWASAYVMEREQSASA